MTEYTGTTVWSVL